MARKGFNAARKRYNRLYYPAILIYVGVCVSGALLIDKQTSPGWLTGLVAALTAAPLLLITWLMLRHQSETDEYIRLRQLTAFARAGGATLGAIWIVGSFQLWALLPGLNVFWFGPFFFLAYGVSCCWPSITGRTV